MELFGKIIAALEPRGGVSARTGNAWKAQSFVLETMEQYPRRCVFDVFGEDKLKDFNIQVGQELTVSFDIDAHEYQGRWYNSIRAWRVQTGNTLGGSAAAPAAPTAAPATANIPAPNAAEAPSAADEGDDLPF